MWFFRGLPIRASMPPLWEARKEERRKKPRFDKGVNFLDKGVNFLDKGVNFLDKGVNFLDKGVNFLDKGVNFLDRGVNFLDKGRGSPQIMYTRRNPGVSKYNPSFVLKLKSK